MVVSFLIYCVNTCTYITCASADLKYIFAQTKDQMVEILGYNSDQLGVFFSWIAIGTSFIALLTYSKQIGAAQ